jgi:DNA helicase HerA-like ATPase
LTGLISRLEARAADPRYGFIFNAPERTLRYEWFSELAAKLLAAGSDGQGIKVIDVSQVPSAIVPIVVGVLARLVYELQFWMEPDWRTPMCLVCDEAHLYLPAREESRPVHEPALRAFEAIAKEGRKYGVSLLIVSQRPTDVSPTILSQCNNFIVMRVTSDHDRAVIERMIPDTLSGITRLLPVLDVGEAVVIGDALHLPTRFRFDAPELKPSSGTQPYWSLWSQRPGSESAILNSAEAVRNQFRRVTSRLSAS